MWSVEGRRLLVYLHHAQQSKMAYSSSQTRFYITEYRRISYHVINSFDGFQSSWDSRPMGKRWRRNMEPLISAGYQKCYASTGYSNWPIQRRNHCGIVELCSVPCLSLGWYISSDDTYCHQLRIMHTTGNSFFLWHGVVTAGMELSSHLLSNQAQDEA